MYAEIGPSLKETFSLGNQLTYVHTKKKVNASVYLNTRYQQIDNSKLQ